MQAIADELIRWSVRLLYGQQSASYEKNGNNLLVRMVHSKGMAYWLWRKWRIVLEEYQRPYDRCPDSYR